MTATGNARSPYVDNLVRRTIKLSDDAERSLRRLSKSDDWLSSLARSPEPVLFRHLYTRTANLYSQFVHELSTNAADAGTVRCVWNASSNRSFWQRRWSPTEDVKLGGQRCQTVWHYNSPADWERVTTSTTEELLRHWSSYTAWLSQNGETWWYRSHYVRPHRYVSVDKYI